MQPADKLQREAQTKLWAAVPNWSRNLWKVAELWQVYARLVKARVFRFRLSCPNSEWIKHKSGHQQLPSVYLNSWNEWGNNQLYDRWKMNWQQFWQSIDCWSQLLSINARYALVPACFLDSWLDITSNLKTSPWAVPFTIIWHFNWLIKKIINELISNVNNHYLQPYIYSQIRFILRFSKLNSKLLNQF